LGCDQKETSRKNGETIVGFSFKTMLQHTGRFWSKDFLAEKNVTTMEHPPYSPELVPVDLYLFPGLKSALKGRNFCDATGINKNAKKEPERISQHGFQLRFQHLYSHSPKCIVARGD
jgi:hypothetical protein